jgi:histidine triad (HIT) family protein
MDCLFCKIISKEIPAQIVYEDAAALGFLDINPRAPGHTVIIPKVHCATILDLGDKSIGPVFAAVRNAANMLKKTFSPDGFTIGINHGASAGQVVEHFHIHVIPRFKNDGGSSIHSVVLNPSEESLESIKEKILKSNC